MNKWLIAGASIVTMGLLTLPSIAFSRRNQFDADIKQASKTWDVPFYLLKGFYATESSFNPAAKAKSSSAIGLPQMIDAARTDVNADYDLFISSPAYQIDKSAEYINLIRKRLKTNDWFKIIRAYYQGVGNEQKHPNSPLSDDAEKYLYKVLGYTLAFALKEPWSYFSHE